MKAESDKRTLRDYNGKDSVCRAALRKNPQATCLTCPFMICMFTIPDKREKVETGYGETQV